MGNVHTSVSYKDFPGERKKHQNTKIVIAPFRNCDILRPSTTEVVMRLGTETGNLMNHIHANIGTHTAKVGDGATILCWTDRHAATVVKVTPTQIHVQEDKAIRTDGNQMSDSQSYRYESNPNARVQIFRKTKRGWRSSEGTGLMVGHRDEYYDYSF